MTRRRKSHLVRQDVEKFPPGTDARWRAQYRQAQYERALIGIQPDLLGGPAIEVFRATQKALKPAPWTKDYEVEFFADLPPDEQEQRLRADPQTPFARTTRGELTKDERKALVASAANWLRVGQRVRIVSAPLSFDGQTEAKVGREGVIWRLCSAAFNDHTYVNLDLIGAERSEKIRMVELRDVEPIGDDKS